MTQIRDIDFFDLPGERATFARIARDAYRRRGIVYRLKPTPPTAAMLADHERLSRRRAQLLKLLSRRPGYPRAAA